MMPWIRMVLVIMEGSVYENSLGGIIDNIQ